MYGLIILHRVEKRVSGTLSEFSESTRQSCDVPEQYDERPPAFVINWKSKFETVQIERDKSTALLFLYGPALHTPQK